MDNNRFDDSNHLRTSAKLRLKVMLIDFGRQYRYLELDLKQVVKRHYIFAEMQEKMQRKEEVKWIIMNRKIYFNN